MYHLGNYSDPNNMHSCFEFIRGSNCLTGNSRLDCNSSNRAEILSVQYLGWFYLHDPPTTYTHRGLLWHWTRSMVEPFKVPSQF